MPIFSVKLPYKVRCNLPECGKPSNMVFKQTIDGYQSTFCSPFHAREGERRWEEKKEKNIQPGVPPKPTEDIMIGDNTETMLGGDE